MISAHKQDNTTTMAALPKYLKLINAEKRNKTGRLNLGNCGLADWPVELFELTWLTHLVMSNNYHWNEIEQQYKYKHKYKYNKESTPNILSNVSPFIKLLKQLKVLLLDGTSENKWQITQIENLDNLTSLQTLNLSYNKIIKIENVATLIALQTLNLSCNQISRIENLGNLKSIQKLGLSQNQIRKIENLDSLTSLQTLYLSNNQITQIKNLETLTSLQTLYLSNNQITQIENLEALAALRTLNLSSNQISRIENLDSLTALARLHLSHNEITQIENVDALTALETLTLSGNQISRIENLGTLALLQWLDLSYNQIVQIENLEALTALQSLHLSVNQITQIENLETLTALETLSLGHNKITQIENLDRLAVLKDLYLHDNQISQIENLATLTSLQLIDLNGNQIAEIKDLDTLVQFENLEYVELKNNPIANVPLDTIDAGWQAIKKYWINKNALVEFKHLKCLLLGNTNVGKSWLLHYLDTNELPIDIDSTHGIRYQQLQHLIKGTTVHCWDFGGQEYFHATHKLFFSPNAINILLWSKINEQRNAENPQACFELNYWLRCVEQLSQDDKPLSNEVLVCENKIDINNYAATLLNQQEYQHQFQNLNLHFASFSLQQQKRLKGFKELLIERGQTLIQKRPSDYVAYYEQLQKQSKACVNLTAIAAKDDENFIPALKVFHNMGILLYFHTILPHKVFVQPQELLDLLYKNILSNNQQYQIRKAAIEKSIENNTLNLQIEEVIALLKHFDLVFQIHENSETYFIPQYLNEPSAFIDFFKKHQFAQPNIIIKSDNYLMNLVMLKLFSKYGKSVKRNPNSTQQEYLFWKDGMVIEESERVLMIKFNREEQAIYLYPDHHHNNLQLQKQIVSFIAKIPEQESLIEKEKKQEEVVREFRTVNWDTNYFAIWVSIDGKFYANYSNLSKAIGEGMFQVKVQTFDGADKIQHKIVSVFDYNKYLPTNKQGKMKKIFISYSKDDLKLVNKFIEHLSALKQDGKVATWYCTELKAGSDWNEEIQEQLDQSDMVCFMISPNFMKTPYIQEYEVAKAFKRKENDKDFKIVPIILDFCRWTTEKNNLGTYTALPYIGKPVLDFNNQNMAWYIIEESLRLMIDHNDVPYKVDENGEIVYTENAKFPKDVLRIFERIIEGKVDKNSSNQ
ncbi:MAG: TIR domain-containing protein [Bacteroidetes bacterium]|nr:MAG: TIR domain-containing protein [Bacteroidota bacterium]